MLKIAHSEVNYLFHSELELNIIFFTPDSQLQLKKLTPLNKSDITVTLGFSGKKKVKKQDSNGNQDSSDIFKRGLEK